MESGASTLSFLDTQISLPEDDDSKFIAQVFRKVTHTGLMLHYTAMCPHKWKVSLIHCLINRAYSISSSWKIFSDEIEHLQSLFVKNGYPKRIFWACVKQFTHSKFAGKSVAVAKEDGARRLYSQYLTLDFLVSFLAEKLGNHSRIYMELMLDLSIHLLRSRTIFP